MNKDNKSLVMEYNSIRNAAVIKNKKKGEFL